MYLEELRKKCIPSTDSFLKLRIKDFKKIRLKCMNSLNNTEQNLTVEIHNNNSRDSSG